MYTSGFLEIAITVASKNLSVQPAAGWGRQSKKAAIFQKNLHISDVGEVCS